jgi:tetratricopeptide (TPR) repeat protein
MSQERTYIRWWIAWIDGNEAETFRISNELAGPLEQQASLSPASLLNALVHWSSGRSDRMTAAADSARTVLEDLVRETPTDPRVHAATGQAYALLGRRDDAVRAGEEAVRLLPVSTDAMDGPEYILHLAAIHALLGEHDEAVAQIRLALATPSGNSPASVLISPVFASVRDHPEIRSIHRFEAPAATP